MNAQNTHDTRFDSVASYLLGLIEAREAREAREAGEAEE